MPATGLRDMDPTWHTNSYQPGCSVYFTQDLYCNDLVLQWYIREGVSVRYSYNGWM